MIVFDCNIDHQFYFALSGVFAFFVFLGIGLHYDNKGQRLLCTSLIAFGYLWFAAGVVLLALSNSYFGFCD